MKQEGQSGSHCWPKALSMSFPWGRLCVMESSLGIFYNGISSPISARLEGIYFSLIPIDENLMGSCK
jgi:hypothetical protein